MACQLNFPNMSLLPSCQYPGDGCNTLRGWWSLPCRQPLLNDVVEQARLYAPISVRAYVLALFKQLSVGGLIQHWPGNARCSRPLFELLRGYGVYIECHAGE